MTVSGRRQPWDRQKDESPQAWEAFRQYRDLGPARSVAKVGEECGKNVSLLERWSSRHAWVVRASAWDAEQDRQWQAELGAARRKAAEKNITLAQTIKIVAGHSLAQLAQSSAGLKPHEIARMVEVAVRIEHAVFVQAAPAAGLGADGVEVDLEALSDEDIAHHLLTLRREIDADLAQYGQLIDDAAYDVDLDLDLQDDHD